MEYCMFKVYNVMIGYRYLLRNDYQNKLLSITREIQFFPFKSELLGSTLLATLKYTTQYC